ncbi:hypothetical protein O181_099382 [Austropuccinia psidii MF-1]|uniref:Uncharacterized protein n=1 Tax=Austropuccinia psidii MF-1 TaxID=1389203 RepID=A0A9Q3JD57_9BASI|nr:hypothetical protein [Austropuccinia psidii MF-1]
MKQIHGKRNWPWWKSQIIQKYRKANCIWQKTMSFENDKYSVHKDPYEWCLRQSKRLKANDPQLNIQMRNQKLLTQMPGEIDHAVKCRCKHNFTLDNIANILQDVRKITNIGKYTPYKSSGFKENQPFRVEFKDKPRERVAEWQRRKTLVTIVVQQTTMPTTVQRKRKRSMQLRKSQRRNPQQKSVTQTLWEMQSENNLMKSQTQDKNF